MKNSIILKNKIAGKILVLNKYILMILMERRENPSNLAYLFDRKVLLTSMFDKAALEFEAGDTEDILKLKNRVSAILSTDESVTQILTDMKNDTGKEIAELNNISKALTAYSSGNRGGNI